MMKYVQVHNIKSAIKIACDFVSLVNLEATEGLLKEQREHRLQTDGYRPDVLRLRTLLWNVWGSLSSYSGFTEAREEEHMDSE